jgi:ArsR family transcriptional regulator
MPFSEEDIRKNRDFFAEKLRAITQRNDILKAVDSGKMEVVLLDTRQREAFTQAHIPGAWCAPNEELAELIEKLPRDREIVTYCWGHD